MRDQVAVPQPINESQQRHVHEQTKQEIEVGKNGTAFLPLSGTAPSAATVSAQGVFALGATVSAQGVFALGATVSAQGRKALPSGRGFYHRVRGFQ